MNRLLTRTLSLALIASLLIMGAAGPAAAQDNELTREDLNDISSVDADSVTIETLERINRIIDNGGDITIGVLERINRIIENGGNITNETLENILGSEGLL